MKKVKLKCQIVTFSFMLLISAAFTAPEASAQADGFFSGWEQISNGDVNGYSNGETDWNQINAEDPTNEADLDGGLLILIAAGTGYLLIRNKQKLSIKFKSVEK